MNVMDTQNTAKDSLSNKAGVSLQDAAMHQNVIAYVLSNVGEEITLDDLSAAAGLSRFEFSRKFQRLSGVSPMRWLWTFRAVLAAEMITIDPHWSMTDVAFACGFSSSAHFSRSYKEANGCSPSQHRKVALALPKPAVKRTTLPGEFDSAAAQRAVAASVKN